MNNIWKRIIAALAVFGIGIILIFCSKNENKSATKSLFAMDTYMEMTAYGRKSEEAVEASAKEITRLDELLSTGSENSEITMLNHNKTGNVSEDTAYLLKRSLELWKTTGGAFDITIYPVMRAWGFAGGEFRVPDNAELTGLLADVDASKIEFNENTKTLTLPENMEIDFGGIAKGYTSERVAKIMKEYGIKSATLNLGGNVKTIGTKPDGSEWKIAIKNPDNTQSYLGVISAKDKAIITSGGYERYFEEDGKVYHHIIDPKTGKSAQNGLTSVTIVCDDGTLADGLSTALYVLGKDDAIAYWKAHNEEFDAVFLDDTGTLYVTQGLEKIFTSELDYEIVHSN